MGITDGWNTIEYSVVRFPSIRFCHGTHLSQACRHRPCQVRGLPREHSVLCAVSVTTQLHAVPWPHCSSHCSSNYQLTLLPQCLGTVVHPSGQRLCCIYVWLGIRTPVKGRTAPIATFVPLVTSIIRQGIVQTHLPILSTSMFRLLHPVPCRSVTVQPGSKPVYDTTAHQSQTHYYHTLYFSHTFIIVIPLLLNTPGTLQSLVICIQICLEFVFNCFNCNDNDNQIIKCSHVSTVESN